MKSMNESDRRNKQLQTLRTFHCIDIRHMNSHRHTTNPASSYATDQPLEMKTAHSIAITLQLYPHSFLSIYRVFYSKLTCMLIETCNTLSPIYRLFNLVLFIDRHRVTESERD